MIRISRSADEENIRALYNKVLPRDTWHKGQTHWVAYDADDGWRTLGFCSAVFWPSLSAVYLSAAGVFSPAHGGGLHRRLIQEREEWARQQRAMWLCTYCLVDNYASLNNLLREGFRAQYRRRWV